MGRQHSLLKSKLPPRKSPYDSPHMRDRIDEIQIVIPLVVLHFLSDPSFTANARRISGKMQTYGGATEAARLIENFTRLESSPK
jgi:hypothetical protein